MNYNVFYCKERAAFFGFEARLALAMGNDELAVTFAMIAAGWAHQGGRG